MANQTFTSVEEAIAALKLDRRHKWFEFSGNVVYIHRFTSPCSGCSCDCSDGYGCSHGNAGCRECGYTSKRRDGVPVPAFWPDGSIVEVISASKSILQKQDKQDSSYNNPFSIIRKEYKIGVYGKIKLWKRK